MSEKWNGTTIFSRSGQGRERNQYWSGKYQTAMNKNPEELKKAKYLCERKGHKLTNKNIMAQFEKVMKGNDTTIFEKAGAAYGKVKRSAQNVELGKNDIETKLQELDKLKSKGMISNEEWTEARKNLLRKF